MLFNEPKLLKSRRQRQRNHPVVDFSALQRAEIAEILDVLKHRVAFRHFSALQRAEIAEMPGQVSDTERDLEISVLFNEPKLLKFVTARC